MSVDLILIFYTSLRRQANEIEKEPDKGCRKTIICNSKNTGRMIKLYEIIEYKIIGHKIIGYKMA